MTKIIMLGTGHGGVVNIYNACFIIQNDDKNILIDTGGGNGLLKQLDKANINYASIHNVFISHVHADHILGSFWLIRKIGSLINRNRYEGNLTFYCNKEVAEALRGVCKLIIQTKFTKLIDSRIIIKEVKENETYNIGGLDFNFFDIIAQGDSQYGFETIINNKKLAFVGDETLNKEITHKVKNCDYLFHEAFCLEEKAIINKIHEKNHSTVKEACEIAESLNIKNIVLYHSDEDEINNRKELYISEGKKHYNGNILVPDDLEIIEI